MAILEITINILLFSDKNAWFFYTIRLDNKTMRCDCVESQRYFKITVHDSLLSWLLSFPWSTKIVLDSFQGLFELASWTRWEELDRVTVAGLPGQRPWTHVHFLLVYWCNMTRVIWAVNSFEFFAINFYEDVGKSVLYNVFVKLTVTEYNFQIKNELGIFCILKKNIYFLLLFSRLTAVLKKM